MACRKTLLIAITEIALCAGMARGADSSAVQLKLTPSGFASMEFGEIVKGGVNKKSNLSMDNTWMKQMVAGLSVDAAFNERNSLAIGMEMQMYNDFPIKGMQLYPTFRYQYFYPYLSQAEYAHVFGNTENPYLIISAGYFPFKYNRDIRNLGEYLFRTGTYPQFILNEFDFPLVRLMGVHTRFTGESLLSGPTEDLNLIGKFVKNFKIDALFYSNLQWYAVGDWNAAAIASENIAGFVNVGLGVTLNSILSSDSTLTTPHDPASLYHITYNETEGWRDSSFYTFKGAKIMAMASIDLKKLVPSEDFGKEDLRLYGEAAILGLKNYPRNLNGGISYDSILERIPVMIGLNVPAFKFLDMLSVEAEYFKCPYPNDIGVITDRGIPIPGQPGETGVTNFRDSSVYAKDNWKWSIYATKTFAKNYTATAQIASDHLRPLAVKEQNVDFSEALHNTKQWYYMLKLTAGF